MKIIKNNTYNNIDEPEVLNFTCEYCSSVLEITKDDTYIGWLGAEFITCPCCGKECMVDEFDGITLTVDNVEFPVHFHRTVLGEGVKEISASEIKKEIKHGVNFFRKNKDQYSWHTTFGNLFLVIFRYSGDEVYSVFVTQDFYQTDIPFEEEDYE